MCPAASGQIRRGHRRHRRGWIYRLGSTTHPVTSSVRFTIRTRVSSREERLEVVLLELIGEPLIQARRAVENPDSWAGFGSFAQTFVRLCVASRGGCCQDGPRLW